MKKSDSCEPRENGDWYDLGTELLGKSLLKIKHWLMGVSSPQGHCSPASQPTSMKGAAKMAASPRPSLLIGQEDRPLSASQRQGKHIQM